nr:MULTISPECIES: hypothetical protein [unclassified Helicobacter]
MKTSKFLTKIYDYDYNTKENSAIYADSKTQMFIETKVFSNKSKFPPLKTLVSQALSNSILYFLQERYQYKNNLLKHILSNSCRFYIFLGLKLKQSKSFSQNLKASIQAYFMMPYKEAIEEKARILKDFPKYKFSYRFLFYRAKSKNPSLRAKINFLIYNLNEEVKIIKRKEVI